MHKRIHRLRRVSLVWRRRGSRRLVAPLAVLRRRAASGIGAVLLALAALVFAEMGDKAQQLFSAAAGSFPGLPLILSPAIFALVAYITHKYFAQAGGSGIPQVIAASRAPASEPARRLLSLPAAAAKLLLCVAILFGGGSAGREGPTVQTSAAIMATVHRWLRVPMTPGVIIAGGAAGVAAAFNTPLAGVAFAIEELAAAYEQRVAVLVMGSVMISGLASLGIAGDYIYFGAMRQSLGFSHVLMVAPVAGIAGGLLGGLFARIVLDFGKPRSALAIRIRAHPVLLAAICGLAVAVIGLASGGLTWGTGYGPTRQLIEAHGEPLWFGPMKFGAALATTLSGVPGGIFAPSLAVGAGFGNLLTPFFPDDPAGAVVLLGMVAYFVGVVRAPLTAVIILTETTASRGMILPLFLTALIAEAASGLVCRERLYHGLSRRFIPRGQSAEAAETASPAGASPKH